MLKELNISHFKRFENFKLKGLKKVNLLVGENNSGKTSILEAIELFCKKGDFGAVSQSLSRRGARDSGNKSLDFQCLFSFSNKERPEPVMLYEGSSRLTITLDLADDSYLFSDDIDLEEESWAININYEDGADSVTYSAKSNIELQTTHSRVQSQGAISSANNVRFISTNSLYKNELIRDYNDIQLYPEEEFILQAMRSVEEKIERIAPTIQGIVPRFRDSTQQGGFNVKLSNGEIFPIGYLGDGVWRILGIATLLVKSKGGVLLIDEIDTGLHYTVLEKLWKLVIETATRLDVQVFCTTHSSDCWKALAKVSSILESDDVSIQRLESNESASVSFNSLEIQIAAESGVEIR